MDLFTSVLKPGGLLLVDIPNEVRLLQRAALRDGRYISAACAAPVTVGWLHPTVILPEGWRQWSQAQLGAVLTHECEHARRRDPLVQWLALLNRVASGLPVVVLGIAGAYAGWLVGVIVFGAVRGANDPEKPS